MATEQQSEFYDSEKVNRLENWLMCSLTSREDLRNKLVHLKEPHLLRNIQDSELKQALAELVVDELLTNYPKIERRLEDPIYKEQKYCLHSFIPSSGATPDKDGVFGILKFRGAFETLEEMQERTEYLIRNVDSYNRYFEGFVGKPFPITVDERYAEKQAFVDIRSKINETTAKHVADERKKEKKDMEDLKMRQEKLQEKVDEESADPLTQYIEQRVRRSHLIFTVVGGKRTLNTYLHSIKKINAWLAEKDAENPDFKEQFLDRYMMARRETGVPDSDMTLLQYINDIEPEGLWENFVEDDESSGLNEELKDKLSTVTGNLSNSVKSQFS